MPESFFQLSATDQADALAAGASASGRPPHLLEKDIWVVWSLSTLFESELGAHLVFPEFTRRCSGVGEWFNPRRIDFAELVHHIQYPGEVAGEFGLLGFAQLQTRQFFQP